jgi:hypothetical protein
VFGVALSLGMSADDSAHKELIPLPHGSPATPVIKSFLEVLFGVILGVGFGFLFKCIVNINEKVFDALLFAVAILFAGIFFPFCTLVFLNMLFF